MRNLRAEMARFGISKQDIQSLLSGTDKTVKSRLDGQTEFSVGDSIKIRDTFFPGMRIEYLFAQDDVQPTA